MGAYDSARKNVAKTTPIPDMIMSTQKVQRHPRWPVEILESSS